MWSKTGTCCSCQINAVKHAITFILPKVCPHFSPTIIDLYSRLQKKWMKERRTKGVINLKKKISDCWILLCSLSPAFVFSSKEHLWRPPGLFHWTLQAFMSDRSISLCCVLHIEHKRNQMWHCENRMFSLSMFHIPLFFFYYINNFGSNNYGWIKEMLSQN